MRNLADVAIECRIFIRAWRLADDSIKWHIYVRAKEESLKSAVNQSMLKLLCHVIGKFYHICLKLADAHILSSPSAYTKLRGFLAIPMDCVSWFLLLFSTFPDLWGLFWYASACLYKNIAKEQVVSINAIYIKLIFCVRKRRFSTIDFNNLTSYVSVYY